MRPFTDVSFAMRFLPYVALRLECAISNAAYDRDIRLGPTFERPLSPPTHPKPDLPQSANYCHNADSPKCANGGQQRGLDPCS